MTNIEKNSLLQQALTTIFKLKFASLLSKFCGKTVTVVSFFSPCKNAEKNQLRKRNFVFFSKNLYNMYLIRLFSFSE